MNFFNENFFFIRIFLIFFIYLGIFYNIPVVICIFRNWLITQSFSLIKKIFSTLVFPLAILAWYSLSFAAHAAITVEMSIHCLICENITLKVLVLLL